MKYKILFLSVALAAVMACNQSPNGVYFVSPQDGATVKSRVVVEMGIRGMTVEPAGKLKEGTGHHHLIIDGNSIEKGVPVDKNETHIHYGLGQTADTFALSPGQHTLTLQFADGLHQSYGKDWSTSIQIIVED